MGKSKSHSEPTINVTPLIDVLLVLLIIFMVAARLSPTSSTPRYLLLRMTASYPPDPRTLVVAIESDRTLRLNGLTEDYGTLDDPSKLAAKLVWLFAERTKNHSYRASMVTRTDLPEAMRIERTVFIKAPRSIAYGEVAWLIDGLKGAGAEPIGLQLDGLN
jgi:biopolymer transport protein ExbD